MSVAFGVVIPPWCIARGAVGLPERIPGETGVDYVSIPAVTGPVVRFRAAAPEEPGFTSDSAWHFPPQPKHYQSLGLRPPKPPGSADLVARLVEAVRGHGMRLAFRLDLRRAAHRLAMSSSLAQRNAWGQPLPHAGPCVANPLLPELLQATAEDLQRYGQADVELLDWQLDQSVAPVEMRPFHWWPALNRLIEVCFCPSCRSLADQAGIDPDQAARSVRVAVERLLQAQTPAADDAVLASYAAARRQAVRGALDRPAQRLAPATIRLVVETPDGSDAAGRVQEIFRARTPSDLNAALRRTRVAFTAWRPLFAAGPELVRFVREGTDRGIQDVLFEGLDEAPDEAVTWIKQAVRFARRG